MNILFLSQVLPYPLDAGPKVRSYYVLRYLARSHRVTLVAFTRATDSPAAVTHLKSFCSAVHLVPLRRSRARDILSLFYALLRSRPFLVVRDDLRAMDAALHHVLGAGSFDAVHADQLSMAHYALRVPGVKRVLDQHNAVWTIVQRLAENEPSRAKRLVLRREVSLLRAHEARTCARFDSVVTVTAPDKKALTFPVYPVRAPIEIIPICIDPDETPTLPFNPTARDVICVGGMFYPPNVDAMVWLAREVMPLIWQASPKTCLLIVGARPAPQLVVLGQREPRIVVTGYVENVEEYLKRAAAFVVPLRAGGGMRVKILDAWARGVPMVTTAIGAEGIEITPGENLLLADSPSEFARAVLRLIQDRPFAADIAARGRLWVRAHYDWQTIYRAWDSIYPPSDNPQNSP